MARFSPQEMENRKYFSEQLNYYIKINNKKKIDLHKDLDIPKSTITGYVKGTSLPNPGNLQKISDYFKIKKSDLDLRFKEETSSDYNLIMEKTVPYIYEKNIKTEINKILDELPEYRQEKVLTFAADQLEQENKKTNTKLTTVKAVSGAAAGVGYAYDNQDIEEYYTDKDLPKYDYATVVCGDSMEPNFSDGDIVLIKSGYNGSNGEIHVIDFDGKSFIKKLYHDGDRLRLISTNTKYDPIYINLPTDTYLNIVGKVVGSFTPKKQK